MPSGLGLNLHQGTKKEKLYPEASLGISLEIYEYAGTLKADKRTRSYCRGLEGVWSDFPSSVCLNSLVFGHRVSEICTELD
jgi:hypothetical protein